MKYPYIKNNEEGFKPKFYGDWTERAQRLYDKAANPEYKVFVDIGVRQGVTSNALLRAARLTGGHVYGVDWGKVGTEEEVPVNDPDYTFLRAESVTVGRNWSGTKPDVVFVDSCHVESYTLCELYYWWDLLKIGGFMAFHDTAWSEGKCDHACGKDWGRVEEGLMKFFNFDSLDYEDDHICSEHFPNDEGYTYIKKKDSSDFKTNINNWIDYFDDREMLINEIRDEGSMVLEGLNLQI